MKITIISFLISFLLSAPIFASEATDLITTTKSIAKVNINSAKANELVNTIKGIGKKRADAIIKYRTEHGNFKSLDELAMVPGLGKSFVSKHITDIEERYTLN